MATHDGLYTVAKDHVPKPARELAADRCAVARYGPSVQVAAAPLDCVSWIR
ncbi:hypothetical protein ACFRCI_19365 [Streptomyces sp. NPDC056638]|uniref:hypothetical protein n=1 Tax=Streptomyces sp. NPDC056638 TaxID=3345887 RepID=UPI00369CF518